MNTEGEEVHERHGSKQKNMFCALREISVPSVFY